MSKREPVKSSETQNQVIDETKTRENQKDFKYDTDELKVTRYPKKKKPLSEKKINLPSCLGCKQDNWVELTHGYYSHNCEFIMNKLKHEINQKVVRQDRNFCTRLPYAKKKDWRNMLFQG